MLNLKRRRRRGKTNKQINKTKKKPLLSTDRRSLEMSFLVHTIADHDIKAALYL